MDLEGFGENDPVAITEVVWEVCSVSVPDDGLVIMIENITAQPIRDGAEYGGVRVRIPARLGNAHTDIQLDIGFGDAITPPAEEVDYPTLLPFPAPRLRAYPRETVVAEKWEAMVSLGIGNSRMKDFSDVWVLSREFAFDGTVLARAIAATFARRGTALSADPPVALTPAFVSDETKVRQWRAFVRRDGISGVSVSLAAVTAAIELFLMPPTRALVVGQAFGFHWLPGGPWQ